MVVQEDPSYRKGDYGFVEPLPVQFDPRFGMAWAPNPKTVVRVATGLFHDAIGGSVFSGGAAFRFTRVTRFTDLNSYLGGTSAVAPVNVSGIVREGYKLPSTHKYSIGLQREIGWRIVTDIAYVGEFTRYLGDDFNHNAIPSGARFNPVNRDPSKPDSATVGLEPDKRDPGALPDVFLRPIRGFGDINISEPVNTARYDSFQAQVSRRFTGGIELAGSYTLARAYENDRFQGNPFTGNFREYDNDIQRHVVVTSYQIDIPNGGRLLGNSAVARGILNDWRVSGISTFATGRWEDVSMSYSPGFEFGGGGELCDGSGSAPYHMVGDPMANAPKTEAQWFDTGVFRPSVGRGDRGNDAACGNHKIQGPGFHNHDVTFFKDFRLPRNQRITFKAEAYNLFNQISWQTFDNTGQFNAAGEQTDANFGRITAARNERRMVFSLRYVF
jgi:hypothetical protein